MKPKTQNEWKVGKTKVIQQIVQVPLDDYLDQKRRSDEKSGLLMPKFDLVVGIDPGNAKLGLTFLNYHSEESECYEIKFTSERLAVQRAAQIRTTISDTVFNQTLCNFSGNLLIAVEGSAFSMPYRNTELAEARIVEALWFVDNFHIPPENCVFIQPNTMRKQVFGNGKLRAEEQWPELEPDAASSLAVAIAGIKMNT